MEVLGLRFREAHLTPHFLNSLIVRLVSLLDPYRRVNPCLFGSTPTLNHYFLITTQDHQRSISTVGLRA